MYKNIMKNYQPLVVILAVLFSVSSCKKIEQVLGISGPEPQIKSNRYQNTSIATGWDIDDNSVNRRRIGEQIPAGMVFVEGGTYTKGRIQDDVMHDWNNTPTQQHVQSFYMDETEVTNGMYAEYVEYLKAVYPPSDPRYSNIYKGALPDTLVWRNRLGFNEAMIDNYLRHPAYELYPVVGVSWIQATEYAQWRTDRVNEKRLEDEGYLDKEVRLKVVSREIDGNFSTQAYLNNPQEVYNGQMESLAPEQNNEKSRYAKRGSGILVPEFRLPTETEWEYAAQAQVSDTHYYTGRKKYPWEGDRTRKTKGRDKGDQLANFKQGKGDYGGIAGWSHDNADITAEVGSYAPNDFGLYDMAGNVSEWVADVYRPNIASDYSDFNYYRGNVFTKKAINSEGKVEIIRDEVVYDTLPNGRLIAVNLPGEVKNIPLDEEDTYLRPNFDRADNISYADGDGMSQKAQFNGGEDARMYNSPKHSINRDENGKIVSGFDKSSNRTSLIGDDVRVFKGGSWRDRAYWLDPAQRRYLPEYMAANDLGFRCAMTRIGSKSDQTQIRGEIRKKVKNKERERKGR